MNGIAQQTCSLKGYKLRLKTLYGSSFGAYSELEKTSTVARLLFAHLNATGPKEFKGHP